MSTTLDIIVALTAERQALYAAASRRWLTLAERQRLADIADDLEALWEQRRVELARRPAQDHELTVVVELRERVVGG